jgi:hypothetical protein
MSLPSSLDPLDYPARFQWGQAGISRCLAQTACTDTCIQMIIEYWKEKSYSLLEIRNASGKGIDCEHGLTMNESLKALNYFGVANYKKAVGVDANFIIQKGKNAPVLFGVGYNEYPAKRGVWCDQNNIAVKGGKVDCNFNGPHAELYLGLSGVNLIVRDPDHWEAARPDYELITKTQMNRTIKALIGNQGWTNTFAIYTDDVKVIKVPEPPKPVVPPSTISEDRMYNVGPSSTYRDATLKAGAILYEDSALTKRYSAVSKETDLGFGGSGDNYHVVINGGRTNYVAKSDVITTSKVNTRNYT